MSSFKPPDPFVVTKNPADAWRKWRQAFELYYLAADVASKPVPQQRAMLLVSLGTDGLDIFNTLTLSVAESAQTVQDVLNALSDYFRPYRNVTYSRHIFFTSTQGQLSIDQFVTDLKMKAIDCDFKDITDSLVRDILICGVNSSQLRERLLKEPNLTLPMAIDICRSEETSKMQTKLISEQDLQAVHAFLKPKPAAKQPVLGGRSAGAPPRVPAPPAADDVADTSARPCGKCRQHHAWGKCPAFGRRCRKCGRHNHFAVACPFGHHQQTRVHDLEEVASPSEDQESALFLGSLFLHSIQGDTKDWYETISLNREVCKFKVDTGSHVNILPFSMWQGFQDKPPLRASVTTVKSYTGHALPIAGECSFMCSRGSHAKQATFYIVSTNAPPILGLDLAEGLHIVSRVHQLSVVDGAQAVVTKYADVFQGLGKMPKKYHITLTENAVPKVHPPRRIPYALQETVKAELARMEREGIIQRVEEPTEWVHPMVVVPKQDGSIRICLDPRELNDVILREHFKMPTFEELFAKIKGATTFTVLDASQAFWQVELDEDSSRICTFATPFGRYRFTRLPFGIKSSPEVFQSRITEVLETKPESFSYLDDILVWGNEDTHNSNLAGVLQTCREYNLKLESKKTQLAKKEVLFGGHRISSEGIHIEPSKLAAMEQIGAPQDRVELQRLLGVFNYFAKHIPNHSQKTEHLRRILHQKGDWIWDTKAESDFQTLKQAVLQAPVLTFFDPTVPIVLSVDASPSGLGAVLLQKGKPVSYASVSLTKAQRNYAHIEKELLAVVFACEHFHFYIFNTPTEIETDHKPLLAIVKKPLETLTPRIQRMVLRLLRYDFQLKYVPGKEMHVADALSRAPSKDTISTDYLEGPTAAVHALVSVSKDKQEQLVAETLEDEGLQQVTQYTKNGWPEEIAHAHPAARPYWQIRSDIHMADSLLFMGQRLIVPRGKRREILHTLHGAHLGMVATKKRAREALYWPNMARDIEDFIATCTTCQTHAAANRTEPLQPHPLPSRPWQRVGADFLHLGENTYIAVVDYYSKYVELLLLTSTTAVSVITAMKAIFARYGIPSEVITDNGPPFGSKAFADFSSTWDFDHITSSPNYPRSNGMVERTIQTLKSILTKTGQDGGDIYAALLELRATPHNGLSLPAELLMGRRIRTCIPTTEKLLKPKYPTGETTQQLAFNQSRLKHYADTHTKQLPVLKPQQEILFSTGRRRWNHGTIQRVHESPRSYIIKTEMGSEYRRNRSDIRPFATREVDKEGPADKEQDERNRSDPKETQKDFDRQKDPDKQNTMQENPAEMTTTQATPQADNPGKRITRSGREVRTPLRFRY